MMVIEMVIVVVMVKYDDGNDGDNDFNDCDSGQLRLI